MITTRRHREGPTTTSHGIPAEPSSGLSATVDGGAGGCG